MASRIASLRLQLIDSVSGPAKAVSGAMKQIDTTLARLGKAGVPGAKRLEQQLESLRRKSGAILEFREARRGLKETSIEMKVARSNVQRLEQALKAATKPTKKMEADLRSARTSLKQATAAFMEQGRAVRTTEKALQSYGINGRQAIARSQQAVRDQIAKTIREIRRLDRESRANPVLNPPRLGRPAAPALGGLRPRYGGSVERDSAVAAGGGYAANAARNATVRGFGLALDFSQAADYQAALGGFNATDRGLLNRQAEKIGGETRFTNADVVKAQTIVLQRGIRDADTIMKLTEEVSNYALAMGVTLEDAAETIGSSALSKQIDLSDVQNIKNFIDFMVWMAKNAGMSDDDVRQYMKYGGAPTTGAGLPDTDAAAIGMILRRSGVRGDEAGVFARSASSKLVAPTKKGRDALAAMGINYSDFVKMPDALNADGIGIMLKNNFGKRLTGEMQEAVRDLMENGEFTDPETGESRSVGSDSGEFVTRMREILEPLFVGKDGKMAARDATALSKALGDYHKYSVESVDVVGLFNAIMSGNPSLGNLNAFFTDRQGGRANMIAQQWPLFQMFRGMMGNVPTGVAGKIGKEANEGLYGDWTKLTGTVETALTRAVQDWEFALRPAIKWADSVVDRFINLDAGSRRLIEAFAAATAVFAGFAAFKAGTGLLGGLLGGGAAGAAGAAAGAAGKGSLLGRLGRGAGALGVALGVSDLLGTVDPDGNLWGATKPVDDWFKGKLGVNPANMGWQGSSYEQYKAAAASQGQGEINASMAKLDAAIADWPDKAKAAMDEYGSAIQTGGADAEAKAAEVARVIQQELAVTGHPDVDTSRLERALSLARQVVAAVRGTSAGGGSSGYVTPPNSNSFGGPRAAGGPVKKGKTYLVGEQGPEPFTPTENGHITSNRDWQAGSGGITVHAPMTFHINGGGSDIKAQIKQAAEEAVATIGKTLGRQLRRQSEASYHSPLYGEM